MSTTAPALLLCPYASRCALFPRLGLETSLQGWSAFYCCNAYTACARWALAERSVPVPPRLFPNGGCRATGSTRAV